MWVKLWDSFTAQEAVKPPGSAEPEGIDTDSHSDGCRRGGSIGCICQVGTVKSSDSQHLHSSPCRTFPCRLSSHAACLPEATKVPCRQGKAWCRNYTDVAWALITTCWPSPQGANRARICPAAMMPDWAASERDRPLEIELRQCCHVTTMDHLYSYPEVGPRMCQRPFYPASTSISSVSSLS